MKTPHFRRGLRTGAIFSAALISFQAHANKDGLAADPADSVQLPSGQYVSPTAPKGAIQEFLNPGLSQYPDFVAGEAVRSQISPDGTTLAIITAGQNSLYSPDGKVDTTNSTQFIFLYDVAHGNKRRPLLKQVIQQANAYVGLVFSPDGNMLYAAGGADDAVYAYANRGGAWSLSAKIPLGHNNQGIGVGVEPNAAGLDISKNGKTLVVANNYNDSISVIDTATGTVRYEYDLRPFNAQNEGANGGVGGTFPFAVMVKGNKTAYISSDRDREVIALDISSPDNARLIRRIKLNGNALGMAMNHNESMLFVAQDNTDQVAMVDTGSNEVVGGIDVRAPAGVLKRNENTGTATFAVTLSPDGNTLYATNAGANNIAVVPLTGHQAYRVSGLIPTAFEPHDVSFSADGSRMYVVNGKSVTGPNPGHLSSSTGSITSTQYPGGNAAAAKSATASNEYQFQLERASLVSLPVPEDTELDSLTDVVARNNFYTTQENDEDAETMSFLHDHIKHVIYVVKENRTFDQILGDLGHGADGDPNLVQFGQSITPNFHRLARQFVTIDNFMDPGDGSMDGWSWALQGRVTNTETLSQQLNYAAVNRGMSYESEGSNRGVPINLATVAERDSVSGVAGTTNYSTKTASLPGGTQNVLTGTSNHASSDSPFGQQQGYIFDAVLQAGGTVRNYGFLVNNIGSIGTQSAPVSDPFGAGITQVAALEPRLAAMTDVYFRGFDQNYPDLWRYNEWKREFDQYVNGNNLPSLSLVRVSHDHMGSFGSALGMINTPEAQQADNDLSVGKLVEAVAKSPYAKDTLIIVTEDDVQDGPDHVDSHRAPAYMVGPYVKQGKVVRTRYSQVNVLRTIEDILGTKHINLNTAYQRPMADVFDTRSSPDWQYNAVASTLLKTTDLNLASIKGLSYAQGPDVIPTHTAEYWAKATEKFDFSHADEVPVDQFNRVLWKGIKGNTPYPTLRAVDLHGVSQVTVAHGELHDD